MEKFAKWSLIAIGLFAMMFAACYLAIMVVLSQVTSDIEDAFTNSFNSPLVEDNQPCEITDNPDGSVKLDEDGEVICN